MPALTPITATERLIDVRPKRRIFMHPTVGRPAWGLLMALVVMPSASAIGQGIGYTPGVRRYRMVTEFSQKQEMMGVPTDISAKGTQLVTVTLTARAPDTLSFTIAIDSFQLAMSEPVPPEALPNYRGVTLTGTVSPLGKIHEVTASSDTIPEILKEYRNFFVSLPPDAALGRVWVDTLAIPLEMRGMNFGSATMITTSKIVGDTIYAGAKAWKIERTAEGSGTGAVDQMGVAMTLTMTTRGSGTIYFGVGGAHVGATGTATSAITVGIPSQNLTLPINQTMSNTTTLVGSGTVPRS